jgi:octaprenyl-diphosphate synthase
VPTLPAIQALAANDMAAVDALVRRRLASDVVLVNQVAEYIVGAGGKRLRPMLLLLAAAALGKQGTAGDVAAVEGVGADAHQLAAVVEFIHTSTLLHDDVVDESTCAVAAAPPMRCGAMPPACWSATSCIRAVSR